MDAKATDIAAVLAEHRARTAAHRAYKAARAAYASNVKADILKAGDLHRYAAALYVQAEEMWKSRPDRQSLADHCAEMAKRLSQSAFARCSVAATYQHVGGGGG